MTAQIRWFGAAAKQARKAGTARGLLLAAEHVLGESRKVVPIEEATLERSGASTVDAASETAAVSYDTPYAVIQHERLDFRHDRGRTAKYLERPVQATRSTQAQLIARAIEQELT